jgi:hypothetical protein
VDLHDVLMGEPVAPPRFIQTRGDRRHAFIQDLYGDIARESAVASKPHFSKISASHPTYQLVLVNSLLWGE